MHLVYIDDSRDELLCVFTALIIPAEQWGPSFNLLRQFRHNLKRTDGIYTHKELHAWEFVSGRGRIAPSVVTKYRRSQIFEEALDTVANLPGAKLVAAVFPKAAEERAFERLLNRINVFASKRQSYALLLCDDGKNAEYTRLKRRMGRFNPIPSQYGSWSGGAKTRNITIDRILEDPVFKDSSQSYFIQLTDFCAFALLRQERPTSPILKYGLDKSFTKLHSILVRQANRYDPRGIIRP